MTEFTARAAAFVRDDDLQAEVLVLAENDDGSGRRLEISRALETTDDDRDLGMDTYCLGNELGATHYGGIACWSLDDEHLTVALTADSAAALGAEGGYRIQLSEPVARGTAEEGLSRLIGSEIHDGQAED